MRFWVRQVLAVFLMGACLVLLFRLSPRLISQVIVAQDDFVEYWAAGLLNLRGADPYNPEQSLSLQLQVGRQAGVAFCNPPWTLPLIMPFGALHYPFSRVLWTIFQTALLLFSASFIWRFYRGSPQYSWLAWLAVFTFFPTLFLLRKGQIGAVVLLGIALFLMFSQRETVWLVALSMLLITVKPQTLYLLELAFVFWAIRQRRWGLLAGCGLGISLAVALALLFNPLVLKQYFFAISHRPPPLKDWATPTLGSVLRYFLGVKEVWLQFVPSALGLTWFGLYWLKKRHSWVWAEQVPLLVAVSVLTTPYGWTFDYVVLILVILPVAIGVCERGLTPAALVTLSVYLAIDAGALAANLSGRVHQDFWYLWLAPALVTWYLLAMRLRMVGMGSPTTVAVSEMS